MSLLKYKYREIFSLSAEDMEREPLDQFFTNLFIYSEIKKKEEHQAKHGS